MHSGACLIDLTVFIEILAYCIDARGRWLFEYATELCSVENVHEDAID